MKVISSTVINNDPSSEQSPVVTMFPVSLSFTSIVTTKAWFRYLVPSSLAESARLVNDANTAKNVAFSCTGAFFAIHARRGIIDTWPSGHSTTVFVIAMNLASIRSPLSAAVHSCKP